MPTAPELHAMALERRLSTLTRGAPNLAGAGSEALGAWFLGPKAENEDLFKELIKEAIETHAQGRRDYYPNDPPWITDDIKKSPSYQQAENLLRRELKALLNDLNGSVPFFSYRYQAHMLWDLTLPGTLGYFAAMLFNQNNVAAEASPVTTWLEMLVGDDLCRMLGYYVPERERDPTSGRFRFKRDVEDETDESKNNKTGKHRRIGAWGHITCDGSVANIEAMWAARNLKCYPVAVAEALRKEKPLAPAQGLLVQLPNGEEHPLLELDTWHLLNLKADDVLALPTRIRNEYDISEEALERVQPYTIQALGFAEFNRRFSNAAADLVVLAPATAHYSWPKGAALLGIGASSLVQVEVDLDARMKLSQLRIELDRCLRDQRPVMMVVAVVGSTEEGAVDPLTDIIDQRTAYRRAGLEFVVHVDAAWGGYFASMLRVATGSGAGPTLLTMRSVASAPSRVSSQLLSYDPSVAMSHWVKEQCEALKHADSITVDPHKAGYIPYPAGGLCYRNSAMRHLVAFTAPVVYHGGVDPTVGVYGIEGSKPGAAAAATYLSHRVIRPDQSGYGRILGRCMFNSKRFYAALVTMEKQTDPFIVVPFQRLPAARRGEAAAKELDLIRKTIVGKQNDQLDPDAIQLLRELGSDLIIIAYAFNFRLENGDLNRDVDRLNQLNDTIFKRLSILKSKTEILTTPLFVTTSDFDPVRYGATLVKSFMDRLGVQGEPVKPIKFLISTTMDPWLTDTENGDFIPTLIEELRAVVCQAIKQVR